MVYNKRLFLTISLTSIFTDLLKLLCYQIITPDNMQYRIQKVLVCISFPNPFKGARESNWSHDKIFLGQAPTPYGNLSPGNVNFSFYN